MRSWRGKINFQAAVYSPFILAIVPAAILFLVLPIKFEKYKAEIVKQYLVGDKEDLKAGYFADLDQDGNADRVAIGIRNDFKPSIYRIQINNQNYTYNEEWVIRAEVVAHAPVLFEDTDGDRLKEVYFFTKASDSIFLNRLDPFGNPEAGIASFYVDLISPDRGTFDLDIFALGFEDHDEDGVLDLTFAVIGGYCRQPRRLYRYNSASKDVAASEKTGIGFIHMNPNMIVDADADGRNEYIVSTASYKNFSEIIVGNTIPYIDTSAWIAAYDDDLEFLFSPIPIRQNIFIPGYILIDQVPHFYYVDRSLANDAYEIIIRNWNGEKVKSFPFPFAVKNLLVVPTVSNQQYSRIVVTSDEAFFYFDSNGEFIEQYPYNYLIHGEGVLALDVLGDSKEEYIMTTNDGFFFVEHSLKNAVFLPVSENIYSPMRISLIQKAKRSGLVSINDNAKQMEVKLSLDPLYFWRHPIWFAIYLSVVLLLWFTQVLQKKQSRQKYEAERKLMTFQFRAIKNQVDPHFTLNALNSIALMQEQGQTDKAAKFLMKFSRMIHHTLENSEKIETTLEEELDFVRDYLDVQQMRFRDAFTYEIILLDETLDELSIPRHLIHTFVENAVKHGLHSCEADGWLIVKIYRKLKTVFVEVEDNGIGREQAKKANTLSTRKGLKIIDELIAIFEKLKNIQISYEIIDKKDEHSLATGTKVLIKIPDHEG